MAEIAAVSEGRAAGAPPPVLTCAAWGGAALAAGEWARTALWADPIPHALIAPWAYHAGAAALIVLWIGAHALPIAALARFAPRRIAASPWTWLVVAALFGLSWQETIAHGSGLQAHPHHGWIRAGLLAGVPAGCAALWWMAALARRVPPWARAAAASAALGVGLWVNLALLPGYPAFHGHLAAANAALCGALLAPLVRRTAARAGAAAIAAAALAAAALVARDRVAVQRHLERFSRVPAGLLAASPATRGLSVPLALEVDPDLVLTPGEIARARQEFSRVEAPLPAAARARHVLLIVVESLRWDVWKDRATAPRFARWRRHGLYLPDGIAQYPATPLAYGAMFTSQPPSVLALTPYWGRRRPFDAVRDRFDALVLSMPSSRWFDRTAITDFFLPRGTPVARHGSASEALANLRRGIERRPDSSRFFAWTHLYEPHWSFQAHRGFDFGKGKAGLYRSEVAYVDHHLGRFMEWFYRRPEAAETLAIVLADHGEGLGESILGERFWNHHVHVHNVVARIPMYFSGPGLPRGRRESRLGVSQLDVLPTVCRALGVPLAPELLAQGRSLHGLIAERPTRPIVTEAFSIRGHEFFDFVSRAGASGDRVALRARFREVTRAGDYSPKLALQQGRHKLIHDRKLDRFWLYDAWSDPGEKRDLARREPAVARRMEAYLEHWARVQAWVVQSLNRL